MAFFHTVLGIFLLNVLHQGCLVLPLQIDDEIFGKTIVMKKTDYYNDAVWFITIS